VKNKKENRGLKTSRRIFGYGKRRLLPLLPHILQAKGICKAHGIVQRLVEDA
jgi:hypothetical protein